MRLAGSDSAIGQALGRVRSTRNPGDVIARGLFAAAGFAILGVAGLIVYQLVKDAWPAITEFGFGFLTGTTWDPANDGFGAAPAIYGTVVSSLIALIIAVPVSLGAAIFLAEVAPPWLRTPLSFLVEMLAALPSVVLGFWGIFVLLPKVVSPMETWLYDHVSFIPLFQSQVKPHGFDMMSAGVILAIMVLPIITAISRDVILAVPASQREAMIALGATRWEVTVGAVLPYCRSGLVGAVILGLGRALGETMAVMMVIGAGTGISSSLFSPASTAASRMAGEFAEAASDLYISALVELGLVLMAITLVVNIIARLLVWRVARAPEAGHE